MGMGRSRVPRPRAAALPKARELYRRPTEGRPEPVPVPVGASSTGDIGGIVGARGSGLSSDDDDDMEERGESRRTSLAGLYRWE